MKSTYIQFIVGLCLFVIIPFTLFFWFMIDAQKHYDKCVAACAPYSVLECGKEYAVCKTQVSTVPIK
jgi:hypothetical protein